MLIKSGQSSGHRTELCILRSAQALEDSSILLSLSLSLLLFLSLFYPILLVTTDASIIIRCAHERVRRRGETSTKRTNAIDFGGVAA